MSVTRRTFLSNMAVAVGASVVGSVGARAQGVADSSGRRKDSTNLFAMDQAAAQTVHLRPKPDAKPQLTPDQRNDVEHKIRCRCGCTLDVYTCRTTDFSCEVSPAMHRDVLGLVEGGYSAQEIIDAFVDSYGERVLMAPRAKGFNLLGYVAPFVVLGGGAVVLVALLRTWGARARAHQPSRVAMPADATAEEAARLEASIRNDE